MPGAKLTSPRGGAEVCELANDRELFDSIRPGWWDFVSQRAWQRTVLGLGIGVQPVLFTVVVFVLSAVITLAASGIAATTVDVKTALVTGTAWAGVFFVWYASNIWRAAVGLHNEQSATIENLEIALANLSHMETKVQSIGVSATGDVGSVAPSAASLAVTSHAPSLEISRPALAKELIDLRVDGVKLRNEIVTNDSLPGWIDRVDTWQHRAEDALEGGKQAEQGQGAISLADLARFITLDRVPLVRYSHAINQQHALELQCLSRRIEILLEIMAKL